MREKTEDRRPRTEDRRRAVLRMRPPVSGLRSLIRDTEGQALLETVIVLPVLFTFVLVIMELSMLYNAKHLANYAAFSAARTAAVRGVGDANRTHFAAALAMSSISTANNEDAEFILDQYGLSDPNMTVAMICSIPGFKGANDEWMARLANGYLRTGAPALTVGTFGTRQNVTATVTYVYRCSFWPFGIFWGSAGLAAYVSSLPGAIQPYATFVSSPRWNIIIHGRAVTDYWAG